MILLSAQNISKTYMERKVLDNVSFFLNEGDKVGIVGINGTGKSTLLRILAGAEEPDSGEIIRTNGSRLSYLPQIPEFGETGSVLEQVLAHLHLPKIDDCMKVQFINVGNRLLVLRNLLGLKLGKRFGAAGRSRKREPNKGGHQRK